MKKTPLIATVFTALIVATLAIAGVIASYPLSQSGQSHLGQPATLAIPF